MTNREWLNTLTDEEFIYFLDCLKFCDLCRTGVTCREHKLNWLKAEHEEENK